MKSVRGFTLIELLVVIAIIAMHLFGGDLDDIDDTFTIALTALLLVWPITLSVMVLVSALLYLLGWLVAYFRRRARQPAESISKPIR